MSHKEKNKKKVKSSGIGKGNSLSQKIISKMALYTAGIRNYARLYR